MVLRLTEIKVTIKLVGDFSNVFVFSTNSIGTALDICKNYNYKYRMNHEIDLSFIYPEVINIRKRSPNSITINYVVFKF